MPRLIVRLLWFSLAFASLYYGSKYGREYYKIKMADTCTQRMWLIEEAKEKFKRDHAGGNPTAFSDLITYIPFTGFPTCPYGGDFDNCLNLDEKTSCKLNGNPAYEPSTPGIDPKKNGYMDLAKKRDAVTIFEFFNNQASWKNTFKDPLKDSRDKKKKELFGTQ